MAQVKLLLMPIYANVSAAIAVTLLIVPQAIAYSVLAGVPPAFGLVAALIGPLMMFLFGRSPHLSLGPTNGTSLLVGSAVAEAVLLHYRVLGPTQIIETTLLVVVMAGVFQLAIAFLKLGRLARFISHSVVIGYVCGVGCVLIALQLPHLLGIPTSPAPGPLPQRLIHYVEHVWTFQPMIALGGITCLLLLVGCRALERRGWRLPAAPITIFVATIAAENIPFLQELPRVQELGSLVPTHLGLHFPHADFALLNRLLPLAMAVALLGILDTSAVSKALSVRTKHVPQINQELWALGAANVLGGLFGATPCSASASRSTLAYVCGATSKVSSLLIVIFTSLIAWGGAHWLQQVPVCSIAALLILTAWSMLDSKQMALCFFATSADRMVMLLTFFSCFALSLDTAFFVGIVASILLYLKKSSDPSVGEYAVDRMIAELRNESKEAVKAVQIINVEGELFFGAADLFRQTLHKMMRDASKAQVIVLRLKNARDLDATACLALERLLLFLRAEGRTLIACGIRPAVWDVLSDSGLAAIWGRENLFIHDPTRPGLSLQRALRRAWRLVPVEEKAEREERSPRVKSGVLEQTKN